MSKEYDFIKKYEDLKIHVTNTLLCFDHIHLIEKFAKYDGRKAYIGDLDCIIEDLGIWHIKRRFYNDSKYNVTLVKAASSAFDHNSFVILEEIVEPPDHKFAHIMEPYQSKLCVFSVCTDYCEEREFPKIATLDQLKQYLTDDTEPNRMIYPFIDCKVRFKNREFELKSPDGISDRMTMFNVFYGLLISLDENELVEFKK